MEIPDHIPEWMSSPNSHDALGNVFGLNDDEAREFRAEIDRCRRSLDDYVDEVIEDVKRLDVGSKDAMFGLMLRDCVSGVRESWNDEDSTLAMSMLIAVMTEKLAQLKTDGHW